MTWGMGLLALILTGMAVYLVYALVHPEKF